MKVCFGSHHFGHLLLSNWWPEHSDLERQNYDGHIHLFNSAQLAFKSISRFQIFIRGKNKSEQGKSSDQVAEFTRNSWRQKQDPAKHSHTVHLRRVTACPSPGDEHIWGRRYITKNTQEGVKRHYGFKSHSMFCRKGRMAGNRTR